MIMEDQPQIWADAASLIRARHRLPIALLGNALMRIAGGASAILVGLYLADLANRGAHVNAALVGTLGAVSFGAELVFGQVEALLLHHEWGFSFEEIAGMLGITAAAARARASRGMADLRVALNNLQRARA
jgi:hypothetical protein